jgi:hypothetical protein
MRLGAAQRGSARLGGLGAANRRDRHMPVELESLNNLFFLLPWRSFDVLSSSSSSLYLSFLVTCC